MGPHIPIDIARTSGIHALVQLLGECQLLVPIGQMVDIICHGVLRHPDFFAALLGKNSSIPHVDKGRMPIDVSSNDVDLFAGNIVVHQFVAIFWVES